MSRTDKTAPYWVKLKCGDLATYEHHDHRNGLCELSGDPDLYEFTAQGGCYRAFHYTGTPTCCCRMCHAADYPRTETQRRRRERRTTKQELRTADPES